MAARLLMIDLKGPALSPDERAFLASAPVAGVCLFRRNIQDRYQLADLTRELQGLTGPEFLIAIDQEGGGVVRALDLPYPPSAMALGAAADLNLTHQIARATARGLRAVGVNVNFAPVADVNNNPQNPVIADRSFGSDPHTVAQQAVSFLQGMQAEGVAATVKHFPGHGDTALDTHLALPTLDVTRERLEDIELVPFRAALAAGTAGVMSFHGIIPQLDTEHPATLSRAVMTGLLREALGFDGVIFTDALDMRAISERYGPSDAALRAVQAGVDVPVHIGPIAEYETIINTFEKALQTGELEPHQVSQSAARIKRLARRYPIRPDPNAAWQAGDEALLEEVARRAVVKLGDFSGLPKRARVCLVYSERVVANAASDMHNVPAAELAKLLEQRGFSLTLAPYDRDDLPATRDQTLQHVQNAEVTIFAATSRVRMGEAEKHFASELARAAKTFVHVALWNPYHALDLPEPALISFGFRPASLKAVARALVEGEAPGTIPIRLEHEARA